MAGAAASLPHGSPQNQKLLLENQLLREKTCNLALENQELRCRLGLDALKTEEESESEVSLPPRWWLVCRSLWAEPEAAAWRWAARGSPGGRALGLKRPCCAGGYFVCRTPSCPASGGFPADRTGTETEVGATGRAGGSERLVPSCLKIISSALLRYILK